MYKLVSMCMFHRVNRHLNEMITTRGYKKYFEMNLQEVPCSNGCKKWQKTSPKDKEL